MFDVGRRDLVAPRWEPFVEVFDFVGFNFGAATFLAQVRDRKDGGFLRADLSTVGSVGAEGITIVDVTFDDGVPTTRVSMRINEATMEAMGTPYVAAGATEAGEDGAIWWGMQIIPSGAVKFSALEGIFTVKAGAVQ